MTATRPTAPRRPSSRRSATTWLARPSTRPTTTRTSSTRALAPPLDGDLAVARITTETDDTWANISAYYDVNGTGTWMPLAYDLNSSWGQFYKDDGIGQIGPLADEDWFKAHPLYGGYRIMAHKSEGGDVIGGAVGSSNCRGNRAIDAIYQDARFRRMYLRRLRTLMDEVLKAPGTAKEDTPFWQWVQMVTDAEWEDARLDQMHWEQASASGKTYANSEIWVWKNTPRFNWDADGFVGTDDSSLIERLGGKVLVVEGKRDNIKLTVPEDYMMLAAAVHSVFGEKANHVE